MSGSRAEGNEVTTPILSPAERERGRTRCSTPREGEGDDTRPATTAEKRIGPSAAEEE